MFFFHSAESFRTAFVSRETRRRVRTRLLIISPGTFSSPRSRTQTAEDGLVSRRISFLVIVVARVDFRFRVCLFDFLSKETSRHDWRFNELFSKATKKRKKY